MTFFIFLITPSVFTLSIRSYIQLRMNFTVIAYINLNPLPHSPSSRDHSNGYIGLCFYFQFNDKGSRVHVDRLYILSGESLFDKYAPLLGFRRPQNNAFDLGDAKTDAVGIIGENRIRRIFWILFNWWSAQRTAIRLKHGKVVLSGLIGFPRVVAIWSMH